MRKFKQFSALYSLFSLFFGLMLTGAALSSAYDEDGHNHDTIPIFFPDGRTVGGPEEEGKNAQSEATDKTIDSQPSDSAGSAEASSDPSLAVEQTEVTPGLTPEQFMVDALNNRISVNMSLYRNLIAQESSTKDELVQINEKIGTLEGQLALLDLQMIATEKKIRAVRHKIAFTEQDIAQLLEDLDKQEVVYEEERHRLGEYLTLLYYHSQSFGDIDHRGLSTVKMFLADKSVSSVVKDQNYLSMLRESTADILSRVSTLKTELENKHERLESERVSLDGLNHSLTYEEDILKSQKQGKAKLLEQTEHKESIFQNLLIQTKLQQEEVLAEIEQLRTSQEYFAKATSQLKQVLSPEQYAKALKIKDSTAKIIGNVHFPLWPVPIKHGFSAIFHDEGYIGAFGVDHGAVDIPTPQGTPVIAISDGIVLHAKQPEDLSYNYIAIAHENGYVSVYGHMFGTLVKQGDFVEMGQIIGLSGGIPGTNGSGYRTTGAHVHLEIHQGGKRVDPLLYMPLELVDEDFIPELYQEIYEDELLQYGGIMVDGVGDATEQSENAPTDEQDEQDKKNEKDESSEDGETTGLQIIR